MKDIFLAVQTALDGIVRWTDFDMGQLDAQPMPPISYPAALIAFGQAEYTPLAGATKIGEATFEVAVVFQLRERTHSKADTAAKNEALEHLDTVQAVIDAVNGIEGTSFKNVQHLRTAMDRRADLRVWRLGFSGTHYPMPPDDAYVPWEDAGGAPPGPAFCINPDIP